MLFEERMLVFYWYVYFGQLIISLFILYIPVLTKDINLNGNRGNINFFLYLEVSYLIFLNLI